MKKYIFIIIGVITFSCNNWEKSKNTNEKVVKKDLRPFFDADKIDHYFVNYTLDSIIISGGESKKSKKEKEFEDIFMGYFPDSIPKKSFEEILLSHNYKKSNLTIKQQKEIENVFSEKDSLQMSAYACVPEYRDIFIFKKKEKTIGVAKICFKCGRFQIVGSKIDTQYFGLFDELEKLHDIVRPTEKKT
ncbi:hypothetical protein IRZ83_07430 [Flavobacterium sp. JLP]|uniref:hypothetical protein n=1 Tax=unclassified Flavobacterium TaxID=196869 RepID=UPI00188B4A8D|nr:MULTISPECIES: hypothetical protein [unclassified Flavobacterium]MBF4492222.1 hypothetical protein [Flavobacterium sp. MR2016-29]MBF4506498.1 hypothetical protein [Flavobacterium sp. JLP]